LLNGATLLPADLREEARETLLARMAEERITTHYSTPTVCLRALGICLALGMKDLLEQAER
jgi:hypothetical protein